jgi:hypothetical protein
MIAPWGLTDVDCCLVPGELMGGADLCWVCWKFVAALSAYGPKTQFSALSRDFRSRTEAM